MKWLAGGKKKMPISTRKEASPPTPARPKAKVILFGADRINSDLKNLVVEGEEFVVQSVAFDSESDFDECSGLIIPNGIFERFHRESDILGTGRWNRTVDRDALALREKQMLRAIKAGAWVCFLLDAVVRGDHGQWQDGDLAKQYLGSLYYAIQSDNPNPHCECKVDEFRAFLSKHGIFRTSFSSIKGSVEPAVIATGGAGIVAVAIRTSWFFLPLSLAKKTPEKAQEALGMLVGALIAYRKKNTVTLPKWVSLLEFVEEKNTLERIKALQEELEASKEALEVWARYKSILCLSGDRLAEAVVEVLRDFFGLDARREEKYVQDASIHGDDGKIQYVVEVKGVNGGIKRDHINQVDSHRERLGLDDATSGLLIINDFQDVDGIEARKAKQFDQAQLAYAVKQNVRILRTTHLIDIMLAAEGVRDRKEYFYRCCAGASPLVSES